jgi:hypothetical protein
MRAGGGGFGVGGGSGGDNNNNYYNKLRPLINFLVFIYTFIPYP